MSGKKKETCPSRASFGRFGPNLRCEQGADHTGLCGSHDGPVWWVWGTPDEGETVPPEGDRDPKENPSP